MLKLMEHVYRDETQYRGRLFDQKWVKQTTVFICWHPDRLPTPRLDYDEFQGVIWKRLGSSIALV